MKNSATDFDTAWAMELTAPGGYGIDNGLWIHDSGFSLYYGTGGAAGPTIGFNAGDYLQYDRTNNLYNFVISNAFALQIAASLVSVPGSLSVQGNNLTIVSGQPQLIMNKAASGQQNLIYGYTNNKNRWIIYLGNGAAESGSNAGSDFILGRFDDNGNNLDYPFTIARQSGLMTVGQLNTTNWININAGGLALNTSQPNVVLNATTTGQWRTIYGQLNGKNRWVIGVGDGSAESGSNAGSDFRLQNYDDNGNYISQPFIVARNTGAVTCNYGLTVNNNQLFSSVQVNSPNYYINNDGNAYIASNSTGPYLMFNSNSCYMQYSRSSAVWGFVINGAWAAQLMATQVSFGNSGYPFLNWSTASTPYISMASGIYWQYNASGQHVFTTASSNPALLIGSYFTRLAPAQVYSTLPAASTAGANARAMVTNSSVAAAGNFGNAVAGGGTNVVPVYSDGTTWRIG